MFDLEVSQISYIGQDLSRPECVIVQPDGTLWISDDRGGVTRRDPDGKQSIIGNIIGTPNGLALEASGDLLVCEIEHGGLHRLAPDGRSRPVLSSTKSRRLGAVNFVCLDPGGGAWVTVSTRTLPRGEAIQRPIADGYILRLDNDVPRMVSQGLCFPNELRICAERRFAYVAESSLGRIVRMPILNDGDLGASEPFGPDPLFPGAIVDGIAFDEMGGLWVTEVSRNGIHRIGPDGHCHLIFEDPQGSILNFPASIAFGGPDLRTVYVGSIRVTHLATFRSPVAGLPLTHWTARRTLSA